MSAITVRKLDETVLRDLRISAARRGVSMEQEARDRLRQPLSMPQAPADALAGGKEWHLAASLEDILALGRRNVTPIDHKAESDAMFDYLDRE